MFRAFGKILPCLAIVLSLAPATLQAAADSSGAGLYNLPGQPPYLMAHYMAWYSTEQGGDNVRDAARPWSHWRWTGAGAARHDPNQKLPNGLRDIASVVYPLIGPYDSASRFVVHYHLATMRAAGISGVIAIWYGPDSDTDRCLPLLLDESQRLGMRVSICYEEKLNFEEYRHPSSRSDVVASTISDLSYICRTYADHPAYLRRAGLPVIVQFNGYGKSPRLGTCMLTPDEWRQVFAALPQKVEYVRQNLDEEYHPPIQGAYVWWNQGDWPIRFAHRAAKLRDDGRLDFFMTMLCPGFNDTGVWGWGAGPRVSNGYGIPILKWTQAQALIGGPELIQLVTWNDFNEATCFEPTTQHHFDFLKELAQWWSQTTHRPIDVDDIGKPFEEYQRTCSAQQRAEIPAP